LYPNHHPFTSNKTGERYAHRNDRNAKACNPAILWAIVWKGSRDYKEKYKLQNVLLLEQPNTECKYFWHI